MPQTGNEGPQLVRSFVAVGAGFFAIQVLGTVVAMAAGDVTPHATDGKALLIKLAYMAVLELLGGYLTARLAIRRPTFHAVILGAIVIAVSLPITMMRWSSLPAWYEIWSLLLVLPMTIFGSHLYESQQKRL